MILIDDGNTELGRALRATLPQGAAVLAEPGEYAISAYPSVVVDVPAYMQDVPLLDEQGGFLGMGKRVAAAHVQVLRMPTSWTAVEEFVAFVTARAAANPVGQAE
ncbi:hypothetical protein [Humidesulfovibrio idahonensis]